MAAMLNDKIPSLVATLESARAVARKKYVVTLAIGVPCFLVGVVFAALMTILNWSENGALYIIPVFLVVPGLILMAVAAIVKHNYSSNAYSLLVNTVDATLFPERDPRSEPRHDAQRSFEAGLLCLAGPLLWQELQELHLRRHPFRAGGLRSPAPRKPHRQQRQHLLHLRNLCQRHDVPLRLRTELRRHRQNP
jgi:hypothetical protein